MMIPDLRILNLFYTPVALRGRQQLFQSECYMMLLNHISVFAFLVLFLVSSVVICSTVAIEKKTLIG